MIFFHFSFLSRVCGAHSLSQETDFFLLDCVCKYLSFLRAADIMYLRIWMKWFFFYSVISINDIQEFGLWILCLNGTELHSMLALERWPFSNVMEILERFSRTVIISLVRVWDRGTRFECIKLYLQITRSWIYHVSLIGVPVFAKSRLYQLCYSLMYSVS